MRYILFRDQISIGLLFRRERKHIHIEKNLLITCIIVFMLICMYSYFKFVRSPRRDPESSQPVDPLEKMFRPSSLFDRLSMAILISLGLVVVVAGASFAAYAFFYLGSLIHLIRFDGRDSALIYSVWTVAGLFLLAIYVQPATVEYVYPLLRRSLKFWQTQVIAIVRNTILLYTLSEIQPGVDTSGIWGALGLAAVFQLIQCIRFDEDLEEELRRK
ncbi:MULTISPECIES: hypothetical protein [Paenibacillus]|uniref:hypothetical protein n=1 Tax=Paenibacillus TaxID=44249 RepID=UPI0012686EC2|nr:MULTISPECIES: hypothetical protein [Paenibacillus]